MIKEISIIKKEEAYTYDELALLEEEILPLVAAEQKAEVGEVLKSLKACLENQKASMAIFFMPQNTFNIFSLIQGDNSICKITKENIEALYKAFDLIENCESRPLFAHLKKKLQVLNEYLLQGNEVTPTVIAADNFSKIEY
jgi:hypothetical protein